MSAEPNPYAQIDVFGLPEVGAVSDSFHPIDLGPILAGTDGQPEPEILRRDDGQCLLYRGQINGIHGDSGTGKGWVALFAVVQQIKAGRSVMILDTEDTPNSIVARLRQLGLSDDAITQRLLYIRPNDPFDLWSTDHLVELVEESNVSLVVIDSLGECFGLEGINENHDAEVGPWLRRVARPLADLGPAVLIVDHSTKANDSPLHPSGSKRKRAAIGGASYHVTAPQPLDRAHGGRVRLTCAKDRHGTYRRGEAVADLVLSIDVMGVRADLYAADEPDDVSTIDRARAVVLEVLGQTEHVESMSALGALCRNQGFTGRDQALRDAVLLLSHEKQVIEENGPRSSRIFRLADRETTT